MIKLVFLGKFRALAPEALGGEVPCDIATLAELTRWIRLRAPELGEALQAARTQIVLNHEFVRDESHPIGDGDEVAFLPPMSGG